MVKSVDIHTGRHSCATADRYSTLQAAIDAAWGLPGGHIHDDVDGYYVEMDIEE